MTIEFVVIGIPCLGLNGGPAFKHNKAFSFVVESVQEILWCPVKKQPGLAADQFGVWHIRSVTV
ncbi:MAG TPA: VOC family protein [Thiobacillus sp.]|nr:VOC family protein [Thiobacillus sp.]